MAIAASQEIKIFLFTRIDFQFIKWGDGVTNGNLLQYSVHNCRLDQESKGNRVRICFHKDEL